MENNRPQTRAHRHISQSVSNSQRLPRHRMKRQASDNTYSDGPSPTVKRHRSHVERHRSHDVMQRSHDERRRSHDERWRSLDKSQRSHEERRKSYEIRRSQEEICRVHDEVYRSHDIRRSRREVRRSSHDGQCQSRRGSLTAHTASNRFPPTYQSDRPMQAPASLLSSSESDSSKSMNRNLMTNRQIVAPSNTPSTSLSKSFSSSSNSSSSSSSSSSQPFYYTMQPENEYVPMDRNVIIDGQRSLRREVDNRCIGKPPPVPNSSKRSSTMFCETSLVSSDMIYDPVFTPKTAKLPRTSTLKNEHLGRVEKKLCPQPSVSTIVSEPALAIRPNPEGESVISDSLSQQSLHRCKQGHTLETHRGNLVFLFFPFCLFVWVFFF